MRLADERGDEGDGEQGDQPRRVGHEPDRECRDRDDVLRLAEDLAEQRRAAGRLPAGALEPVLQLAVLEVLEVQGRGVLHQADARDVREPLGEQRIEQRHEAAEQVGQHGQAELEGDEPGERVEQPALEPCPEALVRVPGAGEPEDLVDDQLADVQRRHRQERADEAGAEVGRAQPRTRLPDELQERREVAERSEALAPRARHRGRTVGPVDPRLGRRRRAAAGVAVADHPTPP